MGKKAWAGEVGEAMTKKIPVGRVSTMITGENVVIDGGYTIQ